MEGQQVILDPRLLILGPRTLVYVEMYNGEEKARQCPVAVTVLKKTREPGIGGVLVTHTLTPSLTHSFWARLVSSLTVRSKLSFSICDG